MSSKILIAGATGVVGHAALEHFAGLDGWEAVALSRRKPEAAGAYVHIAVDLTDEAACRDALGDANDITHVLYAALWDKKDYSGGGEPDSATEMNGAMFRNLMEPLREAAGGLAHVSLLQGTKAYGVHRGRKIPVPAKERWPRFEHKNFYWLQEDYLKDAQSGQDWAFTIFRPQIIFGYAVGAPMNFIPVLGALAALSRESGAPLVFPGRGGSILEGADARLLARAFAWAGQAESARNETFNITNGDVFTWRNVWATLAATHNVETGEGEPYSLQEFFREHAGLWDTIVKKQGLRPLSLEQLIGGSGLYADIGFTYGGDAASSALVSTIKIRQAGFAYCLDTEDAFADWFAYYATRGVLPPLG